MTTTNNEEIKLMFTGLKSNIIELKDQLKESNNEGKKEHKSIKDELRKLCDRMKDAENVIDNHLMNTTQKEKSKREKFLLIIAIIGSIGGVISVFSRMIF